VSGVETVGCRGPARRSGRRFPTDGNSLTTKVHPSPGMAVPLARAVAPIGLVLSLLLAGCTMAPDHGTDEPVTLGPTSTAPSSPQPSDPGFAPQEGTASNTTLGIRLDATWETCEGGFCANVTARNVGDQTYHVSSICESPWYDRMSRDGEPVQHRPMQVICLAYGREPFAPGDEAATGFVWDGQLWDEGERAEPAPMGSYQWTLVYWFEEQEGGPRLESTVTLDLVVGPT
jgi:hypothetical protein